MLARCLWRCVLKDLDVIKPGALPNKEGWVANFDTPWTVR